MTPLRRRRQFGRRRLQIGILNVFCFSAMFCAFQQCFLLFSNDDNDVTMMMMIMTMKMRKEDDVVREEHKTRGDNMTTTLWN